jgi:hypothetical protein
MKRIGRLRLVLALVLVGGTAAVLSVQAITAGNDHSATASTKPATARYHDLDKAMADGYGLFPDAAGIKCIDNQPVGGMGVHYVNLGLVFDTVNGQQVPNIDLDATHPEALVYAPNSAVKLTLAALEYIVFQDAWDAHHSSKPSMFGQEFNTTPFPNRFGIPAFYSLHAWVWEPNSDGLLKPWNPRVHC